jgi:hypothetical protein
MIEMNRQKLLVAGLAVALMAHTSASAYDDLARAGDAAAKALALVKQARAGAGGEEQLANVCVVTAKGTTRRIGADGDSTGPFAFKFFTKSLEGDEAGVMALGPGGEHAKVIVVGADGKELDPKAMDVFIAAPPDDAAKDGEKRIIVRELKVEGKPGDPSWNEKGAEGHGVVIVAPRVEGEGDLLVRRVPGPNDAKADGTFERRMVVVARTPEGGEKGMFEKAVPPPMFDGGAIDSLLSLLLPGHGPEPTLSYVGVVDTAEGRFEAIDMTRPDGFSARFFLDPTSHQPAMVTYKSFEPPNIKWKVKADDATEGEKVMVARVLPGDAKLAEVEVQVRFDDFRTDGNVVLPHRLTISTNGKVSQEISLESFVIESCQGGN